MAGRKSVRGRIKYPVGDSIGGSLHHTESNDKLPRSRIRDPDSIHLLYFNLKVMLGLSIFVFVASLIFIRHFINFSTSEAQTPRVVIPFPSPKIMDLPQFKGEHRESLYWGTYRPQVYFGIRARTPKSLVAGLMWIAVKDGRYFLRHVCDDTDALSTYGWRQHNGRDYGHEVLIDQNMKLSISFLKSRGRECGYGGDWTVRINVENKNSKLDNEDVQKKHLFFYLADEDGNELNVGSNNLDVHENSLIASGSRVDVGRWQLHLESSDYLEMHYTGFKTPFIHNLSDLVQETLAAQVKKRSHFQLPDSSYSSPNILVFQISSRIPFVTDIAFLSSAGLESSSVKNRVNSLTGTSLTNQLSDKQKEFNSKFKSCFNLTGKVDHETLIVGEAAISNLLGGVGYFYGQSKIFLPNFSNLSNGDHYVPYWEAELYTAVPSRPFFPRGFLWDEGFHQLLIWRWDIHICLDIIGHWLDLMNIDGWIPREQILGEEALSKVPDEFVPQHSTNGNPPTLFLALRDIVCAVNENKFSAIESKKISVFLEQSLVRLEAWFQWFNITQSGRDAGVYFWHGRDNKTIHEINPKTLSSGLDDYPRASHPSDDERHLDLRCWMLLAAGCITSIAELLQKSGGVKEYRSTAKLLSDFEFLNQMHFDKTYGAYFDFGNHTEKVQLIWKTVDEGRELVREVEDRPSLGLVPHIGYVSLFPFMSRIIPPESWMLGKQLDLISNRTTLWTNYGLRSLSKTSSLYMKRNTEHDPPYWRGPIWINMNYMILSSLYYYSAEDGPYRDRAKLIYDELRGNLIRNVVENYKKSGYFWEQYEQKKGKGRGARVFTGWTSLVLLIMAESYARN